MAQLEYCSSDKPPIKLTDRVSIGRNVEMCDIAISDKRLSRKHCEIRREGSRFIIEDLDSRNGTRVNGSRMTTTPLGDGDEISLGGFKLRFKSDSVVALDIEKSDGKDLELVLANENADPVDRGKVELEEAALTFDEEPEDSPAPTLKLLKGSLKSVLTTLDTFPFTIGRATTCNLVLDDDRQASGKHAKIDRAPDGSFRIVDLNSTNGVRVEGKEVKELTLQNGVRVQIGAQLFRFSSPLDEESQEISEVAADSPPLQDAEEDVEEELEDVEQINFDETEEGEAPAEAEEESIGGPMELSLDDASEPGPALEGTDGEGAVGEGTSALEAVQINSEGTGGGKRVVRAMEILLTVIVVAAVVGFAIYAWPGEEVETIDQNGGPANGKPPLPGGMLRAYQSFESPRGSAGRIDGWTSVTTAPMDTVSGLADPGVGGSQVMRVQRYAPSAARTMWVCRRFLQVQAANGYQLSVWTRMPKTHGTAFVFIEWYVSDEDAVPMKRDYRAFTTGHTDWTQTQGIFVAPVGASAARVGVGVTGKSGVVLFDQAKVVAVDDSGPLVLATHNAGENLAYQLAADGTISAFLRDADRTPLLRSGKLNLVSGPEDRGLSHTEWLVDMPTVETTDKGQVWSFKVYDPHADMARELTVGLTEETLTVNLAPLGNTQLDGIKLTIGGTKALIPTNLAVVKAGRAVVFGKKTSATLGGDIRMADTANTRAASTNGSFSSDGYALAFLAENGRLTVSFRITEDRKEYHALLQRCRPGGFDTAQGSDPGRITAGLQLLTKYPFDTEGLEIATGAVLAASTYYRIKHTELDWIVNVRTRGAYNKELYLRAVDTALALSLELEQQLPDWMAFTPTVENLSNSNPLPEEQRRSFSAVANALSEMTNSRALLERTAGDGELRAFLLRAESQQIQSLPVLKSAKDHIRSEEVVQARLKLRSIIRYYPYSHSATEARSRLLEIAERLLDERKVFQQDSLSRMAEESRLKALELIEVVLRSQKELGSEFRSRIRHLKEAGVSERQWTREMDANKSKAEMLKKRAG